MTRVKTFDNTGLATSGRLYAGDLNLIQDQYADLVNLSQTHAVGTLQIGESGLQLLRYGPGEARLSGMLRTDGIFRGLGGLYAGAFTTAQRDAISAGSRPYGLIILNTTNNRIEWNAGSDAAPNWQGIAPTLGADSISNAMLQDNSVGTNEIVDGAVTAAELAGSLKPSVSAAAGTEALRALGTGAGNAAAGNDARLSDQRTPLDNSVTNAKIVAGAGIPYSKLSLGNSIQNADIVAGAAISYSKLNLSGSISNADINVSAAIAQSKLATLVINDAHVGVGQLSTNRIAGTAVITSDSRLSDQRVPLDGSVTSGKIPGGQITTGHLNFDVATQAELDAQVGALNAAISQRLWLGHIDRGERGWSEGGHPPESTINPIVYTNFNKVFPGAPAVVAEAGGGIDVRNISNTGFEVQFRTTSDGDGNAAGTFNWIAVWV